MPCFVLLSAFGCCALSIVAYTATMQMFPTLFSATAMGICNFVARLITMAAFVIAEMDPPVPMTIFVVIMMGGFFLTQFIRDDCKTEPK